MKGIFDIKSALKKMGLLALICVLTLVFSACGAKSTDYRAVFEDAGFEIYGDMDDIGLDNMADGFIAHRDNGDEDEKVSYVKLESAKSASDVFEDGVDGMKDDAEYDEDISFGSGKVGKYQVAVAYDEYLESYTIVALQDASILIFELYEEDYDHILGILKEIGISKLPAMEKLA